MCGERGHHIKAAHEIKKYLEQNGLNKLQSYQVAGAAWITHAIINNKLRKPNQLETKTENKIVMMGEKFINERSVYFKNGRNAREFFDKEPENMKFQYRK